MLEAISKLLTLQDKDQRIRTFLIEKNAIPGEIAAKERLIAAAADRLEKAKTRAKEIEVEKKNLQVEAASKRDQIARYRTQQSQTRKNEEFTALTHEIEAAERVISGLEDRELTLMEEAESLKPALADAEKAHREDKERYDGQITALRQKSLNLDERLAELQASRPACLEGIDEDLLERYERLFKNKNGTAVVSLEGEICTGCHMKVTTQTAVAVKSDREITGCPQCGRLLYLPL